MKTVYKATAIVSAVCLVLFVILKLAGVSIADSAKAALTPFTLITLVQSKLEGQGKTDSEKLQTFSDFSYPFWKIFILASMLAVALMELVSALMGVVSAVAATAGNSGLDLLHLLAIASAPATFYILYAVGKWIGIRSATRPFLVGALVGTVCRLFDTGVALALMSPIYFKTIFGTEKDNYAGIAGQVAAGIVFFGGFCVLGAWVGKRRRQAWYLDHLLKSVAPASRTIIVDLTYEEARKTLHPQDGLAHTAAS
ncbi:MAG TPA: hypothetical protein VK752_15195 [Bryobacteraceae bacterium]|jgi:hypothetical protein|nr:hypothetical protein [Bryobacteraceae bacterium]